MLASAAEEFGPHHSYFVSIISRISPSQAEVFRKLVGRENLDALISDMGYLETYFYAPCDLRYFNECLSNATESQKVTDDKSFCQFCESYFNGGGVRLASAECYNKDDRWEELPIGLDDLDIPFRTRQANFLVLEAIGLARRVDTGYFEADKWEFRNLVYYHLTDLGFEFARACKIVS